MADTLASTGAQRPLAQRNPLAWIKRRARRLARAFNLTRREAVHCAAIDWSHFMPHGVAR